MKRWARQKLHTRRCEVVRLSQMGWTQMAIASHLKMPQGTVSRDLAAMRRFERDFSVCDFENGRLEHAQMHIQDLYAIFCMRRITGESGGSHSDVRTCNDHLKKNSDNVKFEGDARVRTQTIAGQGEAATVGRHSRRARR